MISRVDLSILQDVFAEFLGKRNTLQLRLDFLNVANMINKYHGVGKRFVNTQPLIPRGVDGSGRSLYRLRAINNQLMSTSLEPTADINDVYRIQFTIRYIFN